MTSDEIVINDQKAKKKNLGAKIIKPKSKEIIYRNIQLVHGDLYPKIKELQKHNFYKEHEEKLQLAKSRKKKHLLETYTYLKNRKTRNEICRERRI